MFSCWMRDAAATEGCHTHGTGSLQNTGNVFIENTAAINAPLALVRVTLRKPGQTPVSVDASCPTLLVPAGGRLNCTYTARCDLRGACSAVSTNVKLLPACPVD